MGRAMARHCDQVPWLQVCAVVDSNEQARRRAQMELGLQEGQLFDSMNSALRAGHLQVAVISTPSELHYRQAALALRKGLHVLLAKPAVSNISQFMRLRELSQGQGLKVAVGQQMRFNRHYRAVSALVASGELGRISRLTLLNSKPRPEPLNLGRMKHPAMLEMACHHFDALLGILPKVKPLAITARGYRPPWSAYTSNSTVDAMLEFSGGVQALYHCGFDALAPCYELRIEGSNGTLRVRGEHMSAATGFEYELAPALGRFSTVDLEARVPDVGAWTTFMEQWQAWLTRGREPCFSLRRNQPVFALLQAGMESVDRGRRIDLLASSRYRALLQA
jgi:predicted dehydrogenase